MRRQGFTWVGLLMRFLAALVLVYASYNPEGYSYFHWVQGAFQGREGGSPALKFLLGTVLLTGWVVFLNATRRSLGFVGVGLAAAFCIGVIWLFIEWDLLSAVNSRVIGHLTLLVLSAVLAVGMSWSHISQRLTGQVDTDEVN